MTLWGGQQFDSAVDGWTTAVFTRDESESAERDSVSGPLGTSGTNRTSETMATNAAETRRPTVEGTDR
ncbi:hypothetical protein [Halogranum gelatinilyticum]|uniref:hypothetical protein n=1 Tax=Halogranum gelatinilyticum TaxID=660521 RepID=UPI000B7C7C2E|nr:hypothetical protein [Halogranum gelatinilyticum]